MNQLMLISGVEFQIAAPYLWGEWFGISTLMGQSAGQKI
jgi:hypothetical protein